MSTQIFKQSTLKQFIISSSVIVAVALIGYFLTGYIGYRSVALLLLVTVSVLSMFFTLYPVLSAAALSALIWDFFFIPPFFTLHVGSSEDVLMLLMYFIIALTNGFLTSRIRSLEKVELQKEERQNTIKLYKTLFDSISHELRTPIATIVGASDNLMQTQSHLTIEDRSGLIAEISTAAFRLNRLIDNLLSMQRLESGMLKIKPDWCDINELINMPVNRLKDELADHRLIIDIPDDFPVFKVDFGLIEQSLFNLLHNETLYTPPGSVINIQAVMNANHLLITISDNGKGFTEEELQHLFTKFYRATTKTTGGTGLGLSIVKGFVEAHGGHVKVENNIPNGARFIIDIPVEILEMQDYMDFTDVMIKKNEHHQSLTDVYIPKRKVVKHQKND